MSEAIVKGTTPTITLNLTTNLSGWTTQVAFTNGTKSPLIIKPSRIACTQTATGCTLAFTLTQRETLDFKGDTTTLQLRAVNSSSTAVGTAIYELELIDAINSEVVKYE